MLAFVVATPRAIASSSSSFVKCSSTTHDDRASHAVPVHRRTATTMKVLDGLDTVNQDSYTFSRYILGPFQPKVLSPQSSDGDREEIIRGAYRHIFGNAYIMEEERAELAVAESQYKLGALSAKEFVRAVAKSNAYKTRFFEGASQYRFVELNFMHLLGRAPDSQQEMSEHIGLYLAEGVDADIDSYIDSDEYASVFGEDNIPFLRFRGAYTPCDSFNKQCALKGGWANSDKAMGGAALSGYNGSDGRQFCTRIATYASDATTEYEQVAENTPLKSTAPNWYACPDPAIAPKPGFVSAVEVNALKEKAAALQDQYDAELARKTSVGKDALAPFRAMVSEMAPMLDRGVAYSGGDPLLANPYAKLMSDESPLIDGGCKSSDYKRFHKQMENDTLSRIERDLEETKASLRVLSSALASSTPVTPTLELPGQVDAGAAASIEIESVSSRPRIAVTRRAPAPVAVRSEEKAAFKLGPISVPLPSIPKVSLPELSFPSIPNPFAKKE